MMNEELETTEIRDAAVVTMNESIFENTIRPHDFADYIGQKQITDNLKMFITAANQRGDALDHFLFS